MNNDNVLVLVKLAQKNKTKLIDFLKSHGASDSLAEDTFQELCLRIMQGGAFVERLASHPNRVACLMAISRNSLRDTFRRRKIHEAWIDKSADLFFTTCSPSSPDQPDTILINKELREILNKKLNALPHSSAKIIFFKLNLGWTFREIAEHLERSQDSIAAEYYHGLRKLELPVKAALQEFEI